MEKLDCVLGKFCTNNNCSFNHPPNRLVSFSSASEEKGKDYFGKECKWGSSCKREDCKFSHSYGKIKFLNKQGQIFQSSDEIEAANKDKMNKIVACRNGEKCNRKDCKFSHSSGFSNFQPFDSNGNIEATNNHIQFERIRSNPESKPLANIMINTTSSISHLDQNSFHSNLIMQNIDSEQQKSLSICKYGEDCHRNNCRFSHPEYKNYEPIDEEIKSSNDKKKNGKIICNFGENCYRKNCKFWHLKDAKDEDKNKNVSIIKAEAVINPNSVDLICQIKINKEKIDIPKIGAFWQFEYERNIWKPFDRFAQDQIEQAFKRYCQSKNENLLKGLRVVGSLATYTIDFVNWIQINELSQTKRNIRKIEK